jgi:hypothetical protein
MITFAMYSNCYPLYTRVFLHDLVVMDHARVTFINLDEYFMRYQNNLEIEQKCCRIHILDDF